MAKMMKPEVEITRFGGGIDVIATSGESAQVNPYGNLTAGTTYATLRTEATQAGITGDFYETDSFVSFDFTGSGYEYVMGCSGGMDESATYAWYNVSSSQWQTEGNTVGSYSLNPGSTSGWERGND